MKSKRKWANNSQRQTAQKITSENVTYKIKRNFLWILSCIALFLINSNIYGQEVDASIDNNKLIIGDQATVSLKVSVPDGEKIQFPLYNTGDTLTEGVEVVRCSNADTVSSGKNLLLQQRITVTSFDSGSFLIPPFRVLRWHSAERIDTLFSAPLFIAVNSVPVDTTQQIKDIKKPIETPLTLAEFISTYYPYIIGVVVLAGLIVFGIFYYKRWKQKKPLIKIEKPKEPAHVIALRELDKLKEQKLWQKGELKKYHSGLTGIIRIYIEHRYHIPTLERTSYEIMFAVTRSGLIDSATAEILKQILTLADMVKFAKAKPLADENELSIKNACKFVRETKMENKITENVEEK